jgi:hypothetical protein
MPSARVREEDHQLLKELAEKREASVKEVVASALNEHAREGGEVIGKCPECEYEFVENDVQTALLRGEYVRCPNRYESARGEELRHSEGQSVHNNEFRVEELSDEPK